MWFFILFFLPFILLFLYFRRRPQNITLGLFHPYADAGGGGERVLWHAVSAIVHKWPHIHCIVYTGERDKTGDSILEKVKNRFGIDLPEERIKFIFLRLRWLVESKTWPRFTLLGQCLGSVVLGLEALINCRPHVYFDTMGYAFTYPLFRWFAGCYVITYVHYPVVSTDMLSVVSSGQQTYNNSQTISHSRFLTRLKILYYRFIALFYGFVGRRADAVMVNSQWTYGHIDHIWKSSSIYIVYPPCDVETFLNVPRQETDKVFRIVSVGQYRPEKNQRKQLEVVKAIMSQEPRVKPLLSIIGSCRDEEDQHRVEDLRKYASELGIEDNVEFLVNVSFTKLQSELGRSHAAIHTMWNEHFGISLVECMAAGCVMVGHRSGGPLLDIIKDSETGFLADTVQEYGDCLCNVMSMTHEERMAIVSSAKSYVKKHFSVHSFEERVVKTLDPIVKKFN